MMLKRVYIVLMVSLCSRVTAYWLLLQQPEQPPIVFGNIYHPPNLAKKLRDDTINHVVSTTAKQLKRYPTAKLFVSVDFNDLETDEITTLFNK